MGTIIGTGGTKIKELRTVRRRIVSDIQDFTDFPSSSVPEIGSVGILGQLHLISPKPYHCVYEISPPSLPPSFSPPPSLPSSPQKTQTSIKIFSDPMPNSNERSVQVIGTEQQITDCVNYFLDEISKVCPIGHYTTVSCRTPKFYLCFIVTERTKRAYFLV